MKPFSTLLCGCFFLGSLAGSVQLKAEVGIPAGLSPMVIGDSLVINEINYNSSATFDPGDWVELYNPQDHALDIVGNAAAALPNDDLQVPVLFSL